MVDIGSGDSFLRDISTFARPEQHLRPRAVRVWFWRPNVLVWDFVTESGTRCAAELIACEDGSVELQMTGRGSESTHAVQRAVFQSGVGRAVSGKPRHVLLRKWGTRQDPADLASQSALLVQGVLATIDAHRFSRRPGSYPGYWWDLRVNFGDLIGPLLIEKLSGRPAFNTWGMPNAGTALVSVGSIIGGLEREGLHIWGTGLMNPISEAGIQRLRPKQFRMSAVRGRKTYDELTRKLGWNVPEVFGDPALLLPRVVATSSYGTGEPIVIPHYAHERFFPAHSDLKRISVSRAPEEVAADIVRARAVISSSLHGLILAQAFEVPWVWLRVADAHLGGGDFKFEDFFSTLERDDVVCLNVQAEDVASLDLSSVAASARLPRAKYSLDALHDGFPEL